MARTQLQHRGRARDFFVGIGMGLLVSLTVSAFILAQPPAGKAQTNAAGVRLYVLDGGTLENQNPQSYDLTREQVAETDMSVPGIPDRASHGHAPLGHRARQDRFAGGKEAPASPELEGAANA